jgi:hypothetical protein
MAELLTPCWRLDGLGLLKMEYSMVVHRAEKRVRKNELSVAFLESHSSGINIGHDIAVTPVSITEDITSMERAKLWWFCVC